MSDRIQHLNVSDLSDFKNRNDNQLKQQLVALANELLTKYIHSMLDEADDTLFSFSNKADTDQSQHIYLDAMREVRMKRTEIKNGFFDAINEAFRTFDKEKSLPDIMLSDTLSHSNKLELVDDETLEENMAIHNMAEKQERQYHQDIFEVKSRIKSLYGCKNSDIEIHPLSPITISMAFANALTSLEIEFHVKLIIFKLFDKFVMANVCHIYKEINALLIKAKILPNLGYTYKRSRSSYGTTPNLNSRHTSLAGQETLDGPEWDSVNNVNNIDFGLRGFAPGQQNNNQSGASLLPTNFGLRGYAPNPEQTNGVIGTLTAMQNFISHEGYRDDIKPMIIGNDIIDGIHRMGFSSIHGKRELDDKIINMVSMIFDFILEDSSIPQKIKGLLARLQIPYLKLALLDDSLLDIRTHPARKLLNDLTKASIGWDEQNNKTDLYEKIESIVDSILNNYEQDGQLFEKLHQEFIDYWKQDQQLNHIYEERTWKTTAGKERIEYAKKRVDAWVHMWCTRNETRKQVATFLNHFWKNTMLYCMHKFGEDSREWRHYVKIINALIWSTTPGKNKEDVKQLINITPLLIRGLNQGLLAVGTHPGSISNIFREFSKCHLKIIEEAHSQITSEQDSKDQEASNNNAQKTIESLYQSSTEGNADTPDLEVNETLESLAEDVTSEIIEPLNNTEDEINQDEFFQQANGFECGQWFNFKLNNGNVIAKLAWKSNITSNHLFVGRDGLRITEKTLSELAQELRCGNAHCIIQKSIFERALDAASETAIENT